MNWFKKIVKFADDEKGLGLLQVLVVVSALGTASIFFYGNTRNKGQLKAMSYADYTIEQATYNISVELMDIDACSNTFPTGFGAVSEIRSAGSDHPNNASNQGVVVYSEGDKFGQNLDGTSDGIRTVELDSIELLANSPTNPNPHIKLVFDRLSSAISSLNANSKVAREIPVQVVQSGGVYKCYVGDNNQLILAAQRRCQNAGGTFDANAITCDFRTNTVNEIKQFFCENFLLADYIPGASIAENHCQHNAQIVASNSTNAEGLVRETDGEFIKHYITGFKAGNGGKPQYATCWADCWDEAVSSCGSGFTNDDKSQYGAGLAAGIPQCNGQVQCQAYWTEATCPQGTSINPAYPHRGEGVACKNQAGGSVYGRSIACVVEATHPDRNVLKRMPASTCASRDCGPNCLASGSNNWTNCGGGSRECRGYSGFGQTITNYEWDLQCDPCNIDQCHPRCDNKPDSCFCREDACHPQCPTRDAVACDGTSGGGGSGGDECTNGADICGECFSEATNCSINYCQGGYVAWRDAGSECE